MNPAYREQLETRTLEHLQATINLLQKKLAEAEARLVCPVCGCKRIAAHWGYCPNKGTDDD